jgi:hypothetical protein
MDDLFKIEKELKKRLDFPYKWGRKQSDNWDTLTNFIYNTFSFDTLLKRIEYFDEDLQNYALNRWYNFWSAKAVESIFATHPNVEPNINIYDKLVDFKINNIPFDHKTSVYPKGYGKPIVYAKKNKIDLIEWLYKNQSQEGRKHLKNRLFIVLYATNGEHWKLKSEISLLKLHIDVYCKNFSPDNLITLNFGHGEIFSDIIFVTK